MAFGAVALAFRRRWPAATAAATLLSGQLPLAVALYGLTARRGATPQLYVLAVLSEVWLFVPLDLGDVSTPPRWPVWSRTRWSSAVEPTGPVEPTGAAVTAPGPLPSGGHGLDGMRTRADDLGGTLHAGPTHEGGFAVRARPPLTVA
ncbi:hypothetical protein ACFV1W_16735 [Kitasatospora sp. NPDC059648]|uniref:ATP-binding protein n=1 Tax=Kitasatospora sp. NPDC059648 TaxID=3346894 RepID=UPI003686C0D0